MNRKERQIDGALQYLLAATQTKNHFSRLPNDENNRELMKHQLRVQKRLFEQFPEEVRLAAKDRYDALESKAAGAQTSAGWMTL